MDVLFPFLLFSLAEVMRRWRLFLLFYINVERMMNAIYPTYPTYLDSLNVIAAPQILDHRRLVFIFLDQALVQI